MNKSEKTGPTGISKAETLDEIAEFWDTHSLADYWDETQEVEFEVRAKRRRRVPLDPDLYAQIETQARVRGISPETLVNLWLIERLKETVSGAAH
jgi:hypothetical protein